MTEFLRSTNETVIYINITIIDDLEPEFRGFVTKELLQIFRLVNYVIITGPVSLIGIIFNIINIIVFIKIGFKETVNISFLALSIADLCSLIPLIWMSICSNPLVPTQSGGMDNQAVQVIVGWPHVCFSRISGGLTAYITFERYLCVAIPLKIKRIITPRKTVVIVLIIFIITIVGIMPEYFSFWLHPYVNADNVTLTGMIYYHHGREIENYVLSFAAFCQLSCFIVVILSTGGLVHTLRVKSKWRQSTSQFSKNNKAPARDRKTVLMIISISVIFIISYLPLSVSLVGMTTCKEYSIQGRYNNLVIGTATFFLCLESINSSVNIFVYYNMSSKFRAAMFSFIHFKRK
ncbi:unnamed protein product [Candidula unifasciata]|uniref:G-protein coupled receptors family 1 profile domain-containing protein n=1 Tax=Candidula unifasciata TaxID=100452 RepID=A0A8S3YH42_9EUPU|nr:unnamed protein product [Candidula unifasciata]